MPQTSTLSQKSKVENIAQNIHRLSAQNEKALNTLLANEYLIFTKTLNYHWNVTGPRFYSIHELLEEHYREWLEVIDDLAERIRELGGRPRGTLSEFKKLTQINEHPDEYPDSSAMIADLDNDHQNMTGEIKRVIRSLEKEGKDPGSVDFLTGLLVKHEEISWKLRSHLH